MSCHVCKRTGQRTCNEEEAQIKCMICGRCELERMMEAEAGEGERRE